MKVGEVMSKKVVTVSPEASLKEVAKIVFSKKVQAVPVVDEKGKMVGIVAESDLLARFYPSYADVVGDLMSASNFEEMEEKAHDVFKLKVKEIMNKAVTCTYSDVALLKAASKMMVKRVGRLPVIDRKTSKLVGMVSKGDVIRAILRIKG